MTAPVETAEDGPGLTQIGLEPGAVGGVVRRRGPGLLDDRPHRRRDRGGRAAGAAGAAATGAGAAAASVSGAAGTTAGTSVGAAGTTAGSSTGAAGTTVGTATGTLPASAGTTIRTGLETTNNVATVRRTAVSLVRSGLNRNLVEFRNSDYRELREPFSRSSVGPGPTRRKNGGTVGIGLPAAGLRPPDPARSRPGKVNEW